MYFITYLANKMQLVFLINCPHMKVPLRTPSFILFHFLPDWWTKTNWFTVKWCTLLPWHWLCLYNYGCQCFCTESHLVKNVCCDQGCISYLVFYELGKACPDHVCIKNESESGLEVRFHVDLPCLICQQIVCK